MNAATHPCRAPNRQAGFTILQVLVAGAFLSMALFVGVRMTMVTSSVASATVFHADLDSKVHRVVERLAHELQSSRRESIQPDAEAPLGTSMLDYRRAEPDEAGEVVWSAPRRLELVAAESNGTDGIDNDGNGIVDEHEIWLVWDVGTPEEYRSLITRQVAPFLEGEAANAMDDNDNGLIDERGLSFQVQDRLLLIRVSLVGRNPEDELTTRTAETAIQVRN